MCILHKRGETALKNILELLEATAARFAARPAFCDEVRALTWAQVLAMARSAGTALLHAGAGGGAVALYLERGALCAPAMFGALAAGGFYIVLDPAQPPERLRRITAQLSPVTLLADAAHYEAACGLAAPGDRVLCLEDALAAAADEAALAAVRARAIDTDLAYILFTSGSTGAPKGVAIQHRAVLAYSAWSARTFAIDETAVFGNQTPFYFSMSVTDIYTALRTGACVQVLPRHLFSFPVQLLDYMTARGVNTIYWVPSALGIVVNWRALDYTAPPLRTVLFAGETMPTARLNYWRRHYPNAYFANLFGPTETTDICAFYPVAREFRDDEPLPIGYACDNCGLLVVTPENRAAGPGEAGELCVRGSFLAAGYYRMPGKTAERFCQNPLQHDFPETVYRTGDLVTVNERGEMLYLGRIDNQIKHMGYRVEPGEIETAAGAEPGVEGCACLHDAARDRLVLIYQARKDKEAALRARLVERLPAYMQPAVYHRLRTLPQNANGKLDRGALAALLPTLE